MGGRDHRASRPGRTALAPATRSTLFLASEFSIWPLASACSGCGLHSVRMFSQSGLRRHCEKYILTVGSPQPERALENGQMEGSGVRHRVGRACRARRGKPSALPRFYEGGMGNGTDGKWSMGVARAPHPLGCPFPRLVILQGIAPPCLLRLQGAARPPCQKMTRG